MQYDDKVLEYLLGMRFSNAVKMKLTNEKKLFNRDEYLLHVSENKIVVHLGFVDHLPIIDRKIEQKSWLHQRLIDRSKLCFGIDINKKGIEYIQNRYSIPHLHTIDITKDQLPEEIVKEKIDYLLIPDVIEHIGNPVIFLQAIRKKFSNVDTIILTTPNAFRLNNFIFAFKNIECINSDHRFWFTPYTLSKIAVDAGFDIEKLEFCEHDVLSRRQIVKKMFLSKYFTFRDTLLIELKSSHD
ncbi:hypothetical protein [Sulfurovum sp. NBC37-1]|uniref:hypothetical protein n=1 Tax=Sulfurovum sp. (strain NBC37-1) TaxID=387093 RepID=UPI000158783A|nr:hypothetical protein [Sulfurovum sp. NBC37-1]BAF71057.1 conserved hypothetical protein [Sulfurovum sp. NBC37-1]